LLAKKETLLGSRAAARIDIQRKQALMNQLAGLVHKMTSLDQRTYAHRIDALTRSYGLLHEQTQIDEKLIAGYDKAAAMIDIEVETLAAAGEVTEQATATIEAKIAELDALREAIREQERQLSASGELDTFLENPNVEPTKAPDESSEEFAPEIPLERLFDEPDGGDA